MLWSNAKNSAALLVKLHGLSAYEVALKRFDDCTLFGDREGESVWGNIVSELTQLDAIYEDRALFFTVH